MCVEKSFGGPSGKKCGKKLNYCDECSNNVENKYVLESHKGGQSGEKLNYCDECWKDIENKHVLKSHMGDQSGKNARFYMKKIAFSDFDIWK